MNAHGDFETRGVVDLRKTGAHIYADDEHTSPWCFAWAIGDEPVELWTPEEPGGIARLFDYLAGGGTFSAFNAAFELAIWNRLMVPRFGWPALRVEQTRCVMVMCHAMGLPASLANAAPAVGLDMIKDDEGARLMIRMSKPRKWGAVVRCPVCGGDGFVHDDGNPVRCPECDGKGATTDPNVPVWWDDAARRERLYAYCRQDVEVERALEKRLTPLSPSEQKLWELDQRINDRGVYLDLAAIRGAIAVVEYAKAKLDHEMTVTTGGFVNGTGKVADLADWIDLARVETDGLAKADLAELLKREDLPAVVRRALEIRRDAAKSSTAKLKAMIHSAGADGRARGLLQFHAANTGRWGGRRIQTQNMPRPAYEQADIDEVLELLGSVAA